MSLDYLVWKLGDTDPPFLVVLSGPSGPTDLTGVESVRVAYRLRPGDPPVLEMDAEVVNPSDQTGAETGWVRHEVEEGHTEALFGSPEDGTVAVVKGCAEVELMRDGKRVTWPTEGYLEWRVWRDIVEDAS